MAAPMAEVDVDEGLVRALLAEQHPDLVALPLAQVDAGWDNTLWRLGDDLLVRLPRRQVAAPLAVNEQRWLPQVAGRLPLPVPVPVRVGRPSEDFPWPWSVVPWFHGHPGDRAELADPRESAQRLGRFLRSLHQPAPVDAPANPYRGMPLVHRSPALETRRVGLGSSIDQVATKRVWDRAISAGQWTSPPVWLHGDLHPANVIVDHGTLTAVIDFGDICAGDPATDLAGAWMLLPAAAMSTFAESYGGIDPNLERRALGWVVLFALMLIAISDHGRPSYSLVGNAALAKAIGRSDDMS
ncbi:MAG: aminoglycoside phosphotransferase family protein [Acidimicrobiales bacterium]